MLSWTLDPVTKISDFDASDKVHLDNVFAFKNDGWGIIVDASMMPFYW